jgi:hypothetical protein
VQKLRAGGAKALTRWRPLHSLDETAKLNFAWRKAETADMGGALMTKQGSTSVGMGKSKGMGFARASVLSCQIHTAFVPTQPNKGDAA